MVRTVFFVSGQGRSLCRQLCGERAVERGPAPPEGDRPAVPTHKAVAALAAAAQRVALRIADLIVQRQPHAVVFDDFGIDAHCIAEARHGLVLAGDLEHRAGKALGFDTVIAEAELLEQADARLLEPADVVRVVDDAHAVGLVILDFVFAGGHG